MPHSDKQDDATSSDPGRRGAGGSDRRTSRTRSGPRRRDSGSARPPVAPGLLVLDKPSGMTSMTAVAIVRRRVGAKAGHAGTLDPLATGVLVIAVGAATRSLDQFMRTRKGYRTEIDLSAFTATDDREADPEPVSVPTPPTRDEIAAMLASRFTGEFLQTPPAFSAKKVDGKRAYKTARSGGDPKLEPRPVRVHTIELEAYEWPIATVSVTCDKGFYVRSLARELGRALGTGGHCASIRRTAVGPFTLEESVTIDDLPDPLPADRLIPLAEAMARLGSDQAGASSTE
jgi:tRNA pseudouridine55 synthase